jgi:hypothetical protein
MVVAELSVGLEGSEGAVSASAQAVAAALSDVGDKDSSSPDRLIRLLRSIIISIASLMARPVVGVFEAQTAGSVSLPAPVLSTAAARLLLSQTPSSFS